MISQKWKRARALLLCLQKRLEESEADLSEAVAARDRLQTELHEALTAAVRLQENARAARVNFTESQAAVAQSQAQIEQFGADVGCG